jgi:hypothetical protein
MNNLKLDAIPEADEIEKQGDSAARKQEKDLSNDNNSQNGNEASPDPAATGAQVVP